MRDRRFQLEKEKNVVFLKIAFETQKSFYSQNSLSKKIECLDVFVSNLGLRVKISFENVSKQALSNLLDVFASLQFLIGLFHVAYVL